MAGKPARLSIEILSDAVDGVRGLNETAEATDKVSAKMADATRAAQTFDRTVSGAGTHASAGLSSVADGTDAMASKTSLATGALGAMAGGFEALGLGGVAAGMQGVAIATDFTSGLMDSFSLALESTKLKTLASAAASKVAGAATRTWAIIQQGFNLIMMANPIGLVILAIVALGLAIVIAYQKSATFRAIVQAAFKAISDAASFLWQKVLVPFGKFVGAVFVGYWSALSAGLSTVVGWFQKAIEWAGKLWDQLQKFIGGAVGKVLDLFKSGKSATVLMRSTLTTATVTSARSPQPFAVDSRAAIRLAVPVVNVYLDGQRVRGLVSKVVTDAMNADGARLVAGGWS